MPLNQGNLGIRVLMIQMSEGVNILAGESAVAVERHHFIRYNTHSLQAEQALLYKLCTIDDHRQACMLEGQIELDCLHTASIGFCGKGKVIAALGHSAQPHIEGYMCGVTTSANLPRMTALFPILQPTCKSLG